MTKRVYGSSRSAPDGRVEVKKPSIDRPTDAMRIGYDPESKGFVVEKEYDIIKIHMKNVGEMLRVWIFFTAAMLTIISFFRNIL